MTKDNLSSKTCEQLARQLVDEQAEVKNHITRRYEVKPLEDVRIKVRCY